MKPISFSYVIVWILCLQSSYSQPLTENAMAQEYLEKLQQSGYNPQIMPEPTDGVGEPIIISCRTDFLDIYKIDEVNMEFQALIYFRQVWLDPRLSHFYQDIKHFVFNDAKYIWTPDLYLVQEKKGFLHNVIRPNFVIGIYKNGTVEFTKRLTVHFSCPMDFSKFPHDTQKCTVAVQSFGFNRDKLDISRYGGSGIHNITNLPFRIENLKEESRNMNSSTGEYASLEVDLTFQRKAGLFITRLYVPFIFLTVLSWLSFWIPAKWAAHRLSLLLVILYLMVNIGNEINTHAPKTTYTKGSDVWIAVCQSLVVASFLECIAVQIVERNKVVSQMKFCKSSPVDRSVPDLDAKINPVNSEPSNNPVNMIANRLKRYVLLSGRIDKVSSVLFPVLFVVFNFIYWLVYCTGH